MLAAKLPVLVWSHGGGFFERHYPQWLNGLVK
jgi:hypothetical protein